MVTRSTETTPPPKPAPARGRRPSAARATHAQEAGAGTAKADGVPPSRRGRRTRQALVDAARALLLEQGTSALTVKAVTDRADVAHGTFYHHFPSTEAVLAAGIEDSMREFSAGLERTFSDAPDKAWVFAASFTSMLRMLAAHPALPWMIERPHLLAAAIREGCGPYALRDIQAMIAAGDIRAETVQHRGHYWEWFIIGALTDLASHPDRRRTIESDILSLVLGLLGLDPSRSAALIARTGETPIAERHVEKPS